MAIQRVDEVLDKAIAGDPYGIPRFDLIDGSGNTVAQNVRLVLKNPIIQAGTTLSAATLNELLAASGTTSGTSAAYTLAQAGYALVDGYKIRAKIHTDSGANPSLAVGGTAAKAIVTVSGSPVSTLKAGYYYEFVYSSTTDTYILIGAASFQIGDVCYSTKTDMSSEWILANGEIITSAAYPTLFTKLPALSANGIVSSTINYDTSYGLTRGLEKAGNYWFATFSKYLSGYYYHRYAISAAADPSGAYSVYQDGADMSAYQLGSEGNGVRFDGTYYYTFGHSDPNSGFYLWYATNPKGTWTYQLMYSGAGGVQTYMYFNGYINNTVCTILKYGGNTPYFQAGVSCTSTTAYTPNTMTSFYNSTPSGVAYLSASWILYGQDTSQHPAFSYNPALASAGWTFKTIDASFTGAISAMGYNGTHYWAVIGTRMYYCATLTGTYSYVDSTESAKYTSVTFYGYNASGYQAIGADSSGQKYWLSKVSVTDTWTAVPLPSTVSSMGFVSDDNYFVFYGTDPGTGYVTAYVQDKTKRALPAPICQDAFPYIKAT